MKTRQWYWLAVFTSVVAIWVLGLNVATYVHAIPDYKDCPIFANTTCQTCCVLTLKGGVEWYVWNPNPSKYYVCVTGSGNCTNFNGPVCYGDAYSKADCMGDLLLAGEYCSFPACNK